MTLLYLHRHGIDSALTGPAMAQDWKLTLRFSHCEPSAMTLHRDWSATAQALGRDSTGSGRASRLHRQQHLSRLCAGIYPHALKRKQSGCNAPRHNALIITESISAHRPC